MVIIICYILLLFYIFPPSEQKCELRKKNPLDCREIKQILTLHNEARSRVALGQTMLPEGMDMWVLTWDETLARMAQEWANNCIYQHNQDLPEGVGENLSWQSSNDYSVIDIDYLVELWYDEVERYDPEGEPLQDGTRDFTQMVWANTKYIGCGISVYQDPEDEEIYKTLLVCYYRPAGNIKGEKLYVEFEHFSRCSRGVESEQYKGLCAYNKEHSRGIYTPCTGSCEALRPTTMCIVFLFYGYYNYYI
ncbi:unnamed protein product [Nezara viridula]|uniref:SCP domain-containing protein n=1 Tax=Nezara viridula TaxID=85310 RepID=A0A9P0HST6_NEZVI|nr:unnamed protein product [Nezara viridula]